MFNEEIKSYMIVSDLVRSTDLKFRLDGPHLYREETKSLSILVRVLLV